MLLSRNLGKLNFLEPSGPLWACNGTALPKCQTLSCDHLVTNKRYEIVNRKIISLRLVTSFFVILYINMPPKEHNENGKTSADVTIRL